ncbi:hypothetical protein SARC_06043 [Sphaeroforma arctica JP610]|uniref:Uncharacterized protein n=1 Tax=Sphaeroforma arctica JP610 TaxID=667725 RepID=A0A0L0G0B7_9EUKA|nr:hypothetical protein SARC_06043 [Sphaeroforma arctica JP610]KNC81638.1 hypothetical protein SARC_06043 [Sphaeroforma arctica JP610]|eukprot:XP_014155540.1 hypothetical protein SARC_06043 [Sphaeroforma arctica JP610]
MLAVYGRTIAVQRTLPLRQHATQVKASLQSRGMMLWVTNIFNRMDHSQLHNEGPDKTASDFVLRMGGLAKICETPTTPEKDYSNWLMQPSDYPKYVRTGMSLREVNLDKVTVTDMGMEHFRNLSGLMSISLKSCKYITDEGMDYLLEGNPVLRTIDISDTNVTPAKRDSLKKLNGVTVISD